jgi:transcriptional antiterminator RfaH
MVGWYVMHSKPQKEQWLYRQLSALDIDSYYPCVRTQSGKPTSSRVRPYFPGYVFINVDLQQIGLSVLQWIPGSLGLVSFGGEPACVPEGLLQRIRHRVDEINDSQSKMLKGLRPGDQVVIHSGPFAGYDAIFCTQLRGSERVQVLLRVLHEHTVKLDLQGNQISVIHRN